MVGRRSLSLNKKENQMYIEATKKEVEDSLKKKDVVTILFFSLPTCSRCKFILGVLGVGVKRLEELGLDNSRAKILKINCAEEFEIAKEYGVETVPTIVVCHGGETRKHSGKVDINGILKDIGEFLSE